MNIMKLPIIYQATVIAVVSFLLLMLLINEGVIALDVSGLLTYYSFQVFTVLLASVLGGILIGMFIAISVTIISVSYTHLTLPTKRIV